MTRDEWEAQTRDSAEYRRAVSVLDMLSDFRRKVAELDFGSQAFGVFRLWYRLSGFVDEENGRIAAMRRYAESIWRANGGQRG